MLRYTIKRLLHCVVTVLIVVSIVSLLLSLMPTDYYFTEDQLIKLTDEQKELVEGEEASPDYLSWQRLGCWTAHSFSYSTF